MWFIAIIFLSIEINDTGTLNRVLLNGVVRRPGDKVITFVPDLDCASSRKTWVNGLHDYKGGRLREWRKCFLIALFSLARKKKFMVKVLDIGRIIVKSGSSRSNWDSWNISENLPYIKWHLSENLIHFKVY